MASTAAALIATACVRCGRTRTEVLGETKNSRFYTCHPCGHVWGVRRDEIAIREPIEEHGRPASREYADAAGAD